MTNDLPAHHLLSPSSAARWTNCLGAIRLYDKAPKPEVSKYATEGTLAHFVAALILKEKIYGEKHNYDLSIGSSFWVSADDNSEVMPIEPFPTEDREWHHFKITKDMLDAVEVYTTYVLSLTEKLHKRNVYIEKRLPIPSIIGDIDPELALGGTVDAGIHIPFDRLVVLDYKHGSGVPVSPVENKQAMSYALALYLKLPPSERFNISIIEIGIVQPRGLGNGISLWECTPDDLMIWYGKKLEAQKKIHEGDTTLAAGPWCTWCPAGGICTVREQSISKAVGVEVSDLDHEPLLPIPADIDVERLARIVEAKKPLENFVKSAEQLLEQLTRKGDDTGYELKMSSKGMKRQWKDGVLPVDELEALKIEPYKQVEKSPKAIEDELKAKKIDFKLSDYTFMPEKEKLQKKNDNTIDADFDIIE